MALSRNKKVAKKTLKKIRKMLTCISVNLDSQFDFDLFHDVMGLVWIETFGTDAGFELLNDFAQTGGDDIPTGDELWRCWCMYNADDQRYFGMGELTKLVEQSKASSKR